MIPATRSISVILIANYVQLCIWQRLHWVCMCEGPITTQPWTDSLLKTGSKVNRCQRLDYPSRKSVVNVNTVLT
jgi:hypothetical protein